MLPSLAKKAYDEQMTHFQRAVVVANAELYPWLMTAMDSTDTQQESGPSWSVPQNVKVVPYDSVPGIADGAKSVLHIESTLNASPPPGTSHCNALRGRVGKWIPDPNYAASTVPRRHVVTELELGQ